MLSLKKTNLDVLNFTAPCSLDKYVTQWTNHCSKSVFPYNLFSSVAHLRETVDFPPYEAFFSKLKRKNIDKEAYNRARKLYEYHTSLPADHPEKWKNMVDWLRHYNIMDIEPLLRAINAQFNKLRESFELEPLAHLSLPSIAMTAMFNNYDSRYAYVTSFSGKKNAVFWRNLFRDNVTGGMSNVYHRHVKCNAQSEDEHLPVNARELNGEPFTRLISLDFNSMYLFAQDQKMPTTPGIDWRLDTERGVYIKASLLPGTSLSQLQWLYWLQASMGPGIQLQHSYFHGEQCIVCDAVNCGRHRAPVDGAAVIDGRQCYFEFLGCAYHPGCCVDDSNLLGGSAETKKAVWEKKQSLIMSRGAKLTTIRGCVWQQQLAAMRTGVDAKPDTAMPRILERDNESSLLEAIVNGEVYGFVVCDVETSDELIESYGTFLFPWVVRRETLTDVHLSSFMRERVSGHIERTTVIQCFKGQQLCLLTSVIAFYIRLGMKVSNLTRFCQFIPGTFFFYSINRHH